MARYMDTPGRGLPRPQPVSLFLSLPRLRKPHETPSILEEAEFERLIEKRGGVLYVDGQGQYLIPWADCVQETSGSLGKRQRHAKSVQWPTLAPAGPLRPKPPCGRRHMSSVGDADAES